MYRDIAHFGGRGQTLTEHILSTKRDIKKSIEWLEKFESVVLMFDMDDVGQEAAQECAALLSPRNCE